MDTDCRNNKLPKSVLLQEDSFYHSSRSHHAKEKARNWCEGEQITSIIAIPFDPSRMGDALIDNTVKNFSKKSYNIEEGEDY